MNNRFVKKHASQLALCLVFLVVGMLVSLSTGPGKLDWQGIITRTNEADFLFFELRLARTLGALIVGGGLAFSALLLQSLSRNPLAEPGLLGINAGGVLGLVVGITYFSIESVRSYMMFAGVGAFFANLLVLSVGYHAKRSSPAQLVLIGIATAAVLGGMANYILMANETALEQFRFWNLGSLSGVKMTTVQAILPVFLGSTILIAGLSRSLSVMQLGEFQAKSMGVNVNAVRYVSWLLTAILTSSALALSGPIMFAGLIAAFLGRRLAGPYFRLQLAYGALLGVSLVQWADILSRLIWQPFEIPLGVIVALVGTPFVIAIAKTQFFRSAMIGDYHT